MPLIARTHRTPGAAAAAIGAVFLFSSIVPGFIAAEAYCGPLDFTPTASIEALATEGTAPFTVHVHALESDLIVGTPPTARYEWDFGDENAAHNVLEGFNAAHIYDEAGTYQVTLRVTNEAGQSDSSSILVTVLPDTRQALYVAANGNDANPGTSPAQPLKTLNRAMELLQDNMKVLLRRGDVFNVAGGHVIEHSNVLIGAYGDGNRPKLYWVGSPGYSAFITVSAGGFHDIVIQDLRFDSGYNPAVVRDIVDGVAPDGVNNTIRNCRFGNVSLALNCNRSPVGLGAVDNVAPGLAAYFSWAQGTDHTYLGNTVGGSFFEHDIRLANTQRVLIAHNDLTSYPKTTIWAMLGNYCTITDNTLHDGRVRIGPNPYQGDPSGRFRWTVFQRNVLIRSGGDNAGVNVLAGAEHVMIRNNVLQSDGRPCIDVSGYDPAMYRTCVDVDIVNNTGINDWPGGRFVAVGDGAQGLTLCNNLYVAPELVTGVDRTANVYVASNNLNAFEVIKRNVWAIPAEFAWIQDAYHYVWPVWSNAAGYKTPEEWEAYPVVSEDAYETVQLGIDYSLPPGCVATAHGQPVAGVYADLYGNERPLTQAWSVGAVEMSAGGPIVPLPGRVSEGIVVLYSLDEGSGTTVQDSSGIGEPLNLTLTGLGEAAWIDGGISILGNTIIESNAPATKIIDACQATDEITIEAWIAPANVVQGGPARIVTISDGPSARNFTLGQAAEQYDIRIRTTETDSNGLPPCTTPAVITTTLMHVVHTRSATGQRRCYVDGLEVDAGFTGGDFQNWDPNYRLALANELTKDRPWLGEIHLVAIYSRALTPEEVEQNFEAGANPQVLTYDLNGDGVVNVLDLLIFFAAWGDCQQMRTGCEADLDDDGLVGALDLVIMLGSWGQCTACPADVNGDGQVDLNDLLMLLAQWGECAQTMPDCPADFDGDGTVGVLDMLALLTAWG